MSVRISRVAVVIVAIGLGLVAAACSPAASVPTEVPPTPTATVAPLMAFQPITVDPTSDPLAFLSAIPRDERDCLFSKLGETKFGELQAGGNMDELGAEFLTCLSSNTIGEVLIGQMLASTGSPDLAPDTLACMQEEFAAIDFSGIAMSLGDLSADSTVNEGFAASGGIFTTLLPALFCLDDTDRAELDSATGDMMGGGGPTVDQLECIYGQIGADGLGELFQGGIGIPPASVLTAMATCGWIPMPDSESLTTPQVTLPEGLNFTPEQIACLQASVGLEAIARLADGDISIELIGAFQSCGVQLPNIPGLPNFP